MAVVAVVGFGATVSFALAVFLTHGWAFVLFCPVLQVGVALVVALVAADAPNAAPTTPTIEQMMTGSIRGSMRFPTVISFCSPKKFGRSMRLVSV